MEMKNLKKANEIYDNIRELDGMISNKVRMEEYGENYARPVRISDPVFYENFKAFLMSEKERMISLFADL